MYFVTVILDDVIWVFFCGFNCREVFKGFCLFKQHINGSDPSIFLCMFGADGREMLRCKWCKESSNNKGEWISALLSCVKTILVVVVGKP